MSQSAYTPTNNTNLDISELIVAEYNYIAQTAIQANEDRARTSQLFFITFATLIAALYSTQLNDTDYNQVYRAFSLIFGVLFLFGVLTMLQLVRLRLAWLESIIAMDQIKDQLCLNSPDLATYFRWTTSKAPKALKFNSIGFYLAITVGVLCGISLGSSYAFLLLSNGSSRIAWLPSTIVGFVGIGLVVLLFYVLPLRKSTK